MAIRNGCKEILEVLSKASTIFTHDTDMMMQSVYSAAMIFEIIPEEFKEKFRLQRNCLVGVETIRPDVVLGTHTDFPPRVSNLVINVNDFDVTILHSNDDILTEETLKPFEHFLINVTKEHGCNMAQSEGIKFLTLNYLRPYEEVLDLFRD